MKKVLLVLFVLLVCAAHSLNTERRLINNYDEFSIEEFKKFALEMNSRIRDLRDEYMLEVLYEHWENEVWVYELKDIYTYDGDAFLTEVLTLIWNEGQWVNSQKIVYSNNAQGYPFEYLWQMWEPVSQTWIDMALISFVYDTNWNMTEMLIQMWFIDQWMNSSRYTITYNTDNNPTYVLTEEWDFEGGSGWLNDDQEFFTYDGLFLEEILEESWENESEWIWSEKITYTLAGNYHPADRLDQGWDMVNWINQRYSQYTYDGDWNEIEDYEQEWNSSWVNFQTHFYTYVDGYMTERLTHAWEADRSWVNYARRTMTYGTLDSEDNTISPNNDLILSNYPNPFNPETTISFNVTQTSSFVTLEIYNLKGQKVKTLPVTLSGDEGSALWNGTDDNNQPVSSGIYFYKMKTDSHEETKKMILMK